MKTLSGFRFGAIASIGLALLMSAFPVSASVIADCGPPASGDNPLFVQAREANGQVQSGAAPADHKRQFSDRWNGLSATYQDLHSQAVHDDAECVALKSAADATRSRLEVCKVQCDQSASSQAAYQACVACSGPVNAEVAQREAEYSAFTAKTATYNGRVATWQEALKAFITDAEAARGFTGKRFYRMFAKSWIDGPAITEPSWAARKIKMDVNVEPQQPMAGTAFDYKIYQSFDVEVEFVNGKIVSAVFIPGTKTQLANTTFGLRGEVRVTDYDPVVSPDKTRVLFQRRIEGNPHMMIKAADAAFAEAVARSWGLNLPATNIKIYNVLRLTVTADGATPDGEGSSFPTHYFWIREKQSDRRFKVQRQVQPSQYFH
jgi:hypothetical protein